MISKKRMKELLKPVDSEGVFAKEAKRVKDVYGCLEKERQANPSHEIETCTNNTKREVNRKMPEWNKTKGGIVIARKIADKGGKVTVDEFQQLCKNEGIDPKGMIMGKGKPVTYVRGDSVVLTATGKALVAPAK